MAIATTDFVAALQCLPSLTPEQQGQLPLLQQQFSDVTALGEELIHRGWLTPFQLQQVLGTPVPPATDVPLSEPSEPAPANWSLGTSPEGTPHAPAVPELPEAFRFEILLRKLHPHAPVTFLLVALTAFIFLLQAFSQGQWLELRSDGLLAFGADYGPLTLKGELWRSVTSMFLHAGLAHLIGNLCALLLVGAWVERLVGSWSFLAAYLFAGVGASALAVGWFPTAVQVGASGAIFGVYGLLVGCYARGWRTVPWQIFSRHLGTLLVLGSFLLVNQYLVYQGSLIAHLGGALCGALAGAILGPSTRLTEQGSARARLIRFLGAAGLITCGLFAVAYYGAHRSLARIAPYAQAVTHERALIEKFDAAMDRWMDGEMSDRAMADLLEKTLIPEWNRMRQQCQLYPPNSLPGNLLAQLRQEPFPSPSHKEKGPPLSPDELREMFAVYATIRVEAWSNLLRDVQAQKLTIATLTDQVLVELMRDHLNEEINEDNPLHDWIAFSPDRRRDNKFGPKRPRTEQ